MNACMRHSNPLTHSHAICLQLHVAVRRKPANQDATEDNSRDFIFNRRGQEAPAIASVPIVQRQARKAATLDVQTRKKKIRLLQEVGAQPSIIQAFVPNDTVPLRQYFHSRTNEPMLDGEWCFDSDDEPDDDWIHQMAEEVRIVTVLLHCMLFFSSPMYLTHMYCSYWMTLSTMTFRGMRSGS